MTGHWHAERHSEDEDPYITDDLYAVVDYAGAELEELADMDHTFVSYTAQQVTEGQDVHPDIMADALKSFSRMETYASLRAQAENIDRQVRAEPADHAPVYQDDLPYDPESGEVNTASKIYVATLHVVERINSESPISIWQCQAETGVYPDTDRDNAGNLFCREYE